MRSLARPTCFIKSLMGEGKGRASSCAISVCAGNRFGLCTAGRAGGFADARRGGLAAAERARRVGARGCGQPEGRGVTRVTVSADAETITIHIPLEFSKRGRRKLVVAPDGAEWAPRPRVDNAMVKALARAEDAGHWRLRDAGGFGDGEGRRAVLRWPKAAADAADSGDRLGDPWRAAAGEGVTRHGPCACAAADRVSTG